MRFSKKVWGPNGVGGAWYGIFLIREKPALRADLINRYINSKEYIYFVRTFFYHGTNMI